MANMNERDSKVHVTITHKREKNKPKYNFSVVMSGLLITSTLLASFSGLTAHAAGLDTDYASNITNPTPIVATYQREASSKVTSLLNTSYEELLLISNKLNNDNATLKALLQVNQSLNEANERMDSEDYNATEVIALATMIRTALDGVDTNLSQAGYNSNSSQRVLVTQMQNTINEINAKAGSNLSDSSKPVVTPTSKENGIEKGLHHFKFDNAPMQFTDVPSNAWFYKDVSKASAAGIIHGVGNNQFNPDGHLTEAEAMTLMANVYAIYNADTDLLDIYKSRTQGDHWASGIKAYCEYRGLATPDEADFDKDCSRGTMAFYFARSMDTSVFTPINDPDDAPEDLQRLNNREVSLLFTSGVMIGDQNGFRLHDSITRSETAAIIHRVANLDARVKATPKQETQTPVEKDPTPVTPVQPGQTSYELRYLNIPHTRWNGDSSVSGNFSIQGQNGYINTKFGNHSYGCANQQEYDAVMKAVEEAYQYAIKKESTNTYTNRVNKGIEDVYGRETDRIYIFLKDGVGLGTKDRVISWRVTQSIVGYMNSYLKDNYAAKSGVPHVTDGKDNNVYKYLFGSGQLDCDGSANLYMLCYDYLGFSTRTIGSYNVSHQVAEVYVNGHWILINQDTGGIDDITHAELMQMISSGSDCGIKTGSKDMIVLTAKNGKGSQLSDLAVDNTPTHAPNDRSL